MNSLFFFAAEVVTTTAKTAGDVGTSAGGDSSTWKLIVAFLTGGILIKAVGWVADWLDGKGAKLIEARLAKFEEKLDSTQVGSQILADNALFKIANGAVPELLGLVTDTVRQDLKDGKFDKVDWEDIGSKMWTITKDHVQGGAHDYIKTSSFADGQVAMSWIVKKLFNKKKEETK